MRLARVVIISGRYKMKMFTALLIGGIVCLTLAATKLTGSDRPEWDQEKAKEAVRKVIAIENEGQAWDKVDWRTDVEAAVEEAKREQKPIFVYWYVDKGGPADAPC